MCNKCQGCSNAACCRHCNYIYRSTDSISECTGTGYTSAFVHLPSTLLCSVPPRPPLWTCSLAKPECSTLRSLLTSSAADRTPPPAVCGRWGAPPAQRPAVLQERQVRRLQHRPRLQAAPIRLCKHAGSVLPNPESGYECEAFVRLCNLCWRPPGPERELNASTQCQHVDMVTVSGPMPSAQGLRHAGHVQHGV